jgi:hypothetical protein
MKSKLFVLIVFIVIALIFCTISSFASYNFLSSESNTALEDLKWKYYGVKEIILEKEHGFVWTVILPKNDGVEIEEAQEAVYNDETEEFEGSYNFTYITIRNAKGWTEVIWGSASKFYPYDVPKLCFVFDS